MIRVLARLADGTVRRDLTPEALHELRGSPARAGLRVWVDIQSSGTAAPGEEHALLQAFGIHEVAIEDALQEVHVPKLVDWSGYLYMVLHVDRLDTESRTLETHELDFFLGDGFLISHHTDDSPLLDAAWRRQEDSPEALERGVGYQLHLLLDAVIEAQRPLVEGFQDWIDEAEAEVLESPSSHTLESILGARRGLLVVRRSLRGLQQAVTRLAREDLGGISGEDRIYFRDVLDNLASQTEALDATRELVGGAMDTYLSVTTNRTNEIMYTLTLVTALFLPISFLAGFFGMNFFGPEFTIHPGEVGQPVFWATIAAMVAIPPSMIVWMRVRGWF
jgi:magnesium transporter